jgi:polar amino acid transport system substrate-binding protein
VNEKIVAFLFLTSSLQKNRWFSSRIHEDLKGRIGGRFVSGSYGEAFDLYSEKYLEQEFVTSHKQLFLKLLAGRNDYVIMDYLDGVANLNELKLADQVAVLSEPVVVNKVYLAISKKSDLASYLDEINACILQFRKTRKLSQILNKYEPLYNRKGLEAYIGCAPE